MNQSFTVERSFHVGTGRHSRKEIRQGRGPAPLPEGRIPRVSRLMALAIRFEQLIAECTVADQAELARLGHVSRARLTQIMNLLNLAPDIQEQLLHLPRVQQGRDPVTERELRPICALADWSKQRRMWRDASTG
jgi:hypothetical protein